jgi:glycine cleavage system H lipoate-binding protein
MAVVLLLVTFAVFALIDYLLHRKQPVRIAQTESPAAAAAFLQPAYVDGFAVPEELRYHHGHSWTFRERKNLARIGADEFAAVLSGGIEKIELPKPGQWVRQGQKAWSITRKGEITEMVSPTEGEVIEINEELLKDPSLLRKDPYGRGWLMTVHVPDEESTARNLIPKTMVHNWMRQSVERLYAMQPQLAGAVAADGGRPVDDIFEHLPEASWKDVTREFFLTC